LHMGHALFVTVEDILIRWQRMRGRPALWLPGADHAGIAGQWVVEKELADEGLTRHDLGRERFLERTWEWMDRYRGRIREQLRILGASCDWSRFRFTMDPGPARAVRTAFKALYDEGLIYRGERMINWCPRCMTALSDLEVNHEEMQSHLWTLRYPVDGTDRYVEVATTRPETMLGDTGVAVHPDDERYKDLVGHTATLPIIGRKLRIIADDAVDPAFGTGAVKVTPAHDPTDFEIGQRHSLPAVTVINLDGTMTEEAGPYAGQSREDARKGVVEQLEREGYLVGVEPYTHSVGRCDRCDTIVEPLLSKQWFVEMKPLAGPAIEVARNETVRFIPERFRGVYLHWLENVHDWCISRQLWWGHRIPVWYCQDCGELTVSAEETVTSCATCGSSRLEQDPDVLDTWFSSGLWPFSTLGWPARTDDLERYYPGTVMETGYDIIFLWVARMIFFGLKFMGEVPFSDVYFHGTVRDERGQRMSKTKGNVLDPTELTAEYGSDALRFALVTAAPAGADLKMSADRIEVGRNFVNKLWNASRFVLRSLESADLARDASGQLARPEPETLSLADRWILSRLDVTTAEVDRQLERFDMNEAGRKLYDFVWSEYCDWYIESTKVALSGADRGGRAVAQQTLAYVLDRSLRLLHPFIPFVTEELWHFLPHDGEALITAPWPQPGQRDEVAEREYGLLMDLVRSIRNARAEYGVPPGRLIRALVSAGEHAGSLDAQREVLCRLARLDPGELSVVESLAEPPEQSVSLVIGSDLQVYLPLAGLVDVDEERKRLESEVAAARSAAERARGRLSNRQFTDRAPAHVVDAERERLAQAEERARLLEARLIALG
ncbi:MAG: valine--tRNA ligase, partial [Chloroflexota bacterium]|nr:valine--tRNA ligase [Chloroflexota bacterium]